MTRDTETTADDSGTTTVTASGSSDTMGEISHTNPYTDESTGHLFNRGPIVAADGGRSTAVESDDEQSDRTETADRTAGDERTMKTVSHTPPTEEADGNRTNRVFERGRVGAGTADTEDDK